MNSSHPGWGTPRGMLPYVCALVLIALVLLIAWYLMGKTEHSISLVLRIFAGGELSASS